MLSLTLFISIACLLQASSVQAQKSRHRSLMAGYKSFSETLHRAKQTIHGTSDRSRRLSENKSQAKLASTGTRRVKSKKDKQSKTQKQSKKSSTADDLQDLALKQKLLTASFEAGYCDAQANAPSYLYVQMADECTLSRTMDSDGNYTYQLSSSSMDDETYKFSDRPVQVADTLTTPDFFTSFYDIFTDASGGRPNAAVTFMDADTSVFEGPMIAVLLEAAYVASDGTAVYDISQSESQSSVGLVSDFFPGGADAVQLDSCSLFIDSVTKKNPEGLMFYFDDKITLYPDDSKVFFTPKKTFGLVFQGDANLVLYDYTVSPRRPRWASKDGGDYGSDAVFLRFQGDGNLVIYRSNGVMWASGTASYFVPAPQPIFSGGDGAYNPLPLTNSALADRTYFGQALIVTDGGQMAIIAKARDHPEEITTLKAAGGGKFSDGRLTFGQQVLLGFGIGLAGGVILLGAGAAIGAVAPEAVAVTAEVGTETFSETSFSVMSSSVVEMSPSEIESWGEAARDLLNF